MCFYRNRLIPFSSWVMGWEIRPWPRGFAFFLLSPLPSFLALCVSACWSLCLFVPVLLTVYPCFFTFVCFCSALDFKDKEGQHDNRRE